MNNHQRPSSARPTSAATRPSSSQSSSTGTKSSSEIELNTMVYPSFGSLNLTIRQDDSTGMDVSMGVGTGTGIGTGASTDPNKLIVKKSTSSTNFLQLPNDPTSGTLGSANHGVGSMSGISGISGMGLGGNNTGLTDPTMLLTNTTSNTDTYTYTYPNENETTNVGNNTNTNTNNNVQNQNANNTKTKTQMESEVEVEVDYQRHYDHYRGWKLTIPAPTFYSPREHYDSQCIELYSGHTSILGPDYDHDTEYEHGNDNVNGHDHDDLIVQPFVKSPNIITTTLSSTEPEDQYLKSPKTIATGTIIFDDDDDDNDDIDDDNDNGNNNIGNSNDNEKSTPMKKNDISNKTNTRTRTHTRTRTRSIEKMSLLSPSSNILSAEYKEEMKNNLSLLTSSAWTYAASTPRSRPMSRTMSKPKTKSTPMSHWKISSNTLLTVTYKKSIHCIPEYTNTNICMDYVNRFMNFTTSCRSSSSSSSSSNNNGNGCGSSGTNMNCKGIGGDGNNVEVFKENYTEKDIAAVKTYNIKITGFTGICTAVQIHFQSKKCNYDDYEVDGTKSTDNNSNAPTSSTSSTSSSTSKHRFDYNDTTTTNNNNTSSTSTSTSTTLSKEQKLKMKLQKYIDRSKSNHQNILPNDGNLILENNDYGINNDYGLPLPPWDPKAKQEKQKQHQQQHGYQYDYGHYDYSKSNDKLTGKSFIGGIGDIDIGGSSSSDANRYHRHLDDDEDAHKDDYNVGTGGDYDTFYDMDIDMNGPNVQHNDDDDDDVFYGPILTFAVPNLLDENQIDPSRSKSKTQDSVPLLWKVDFPPDPSIAVEALTVLDGVLDIHPNPLEEDDDSSTSSSSYSTCSKEECDACHPTNIYINGYQSWSFAGSVNQGEAQPQSAMPNFLSKAFNYGADVPPVADTTVESGQWENKTMKNGINIKRKCGRSTTMDDFDDDDYPFHEATHYKSDFYTCVSTTNIERCHSQASAAGNTFSSKGSFNQNSRTKLDEMGGTALVLGFLSQRKQLGLITFDSELERVAMHASLQGVIASRSSGISTDWAYCQILPAHAYDEEPMVHYLNAVSAYNNARPLQSHPPLTGWCSWYHYYENIDLKTLNANFTKMSGLKSTISQDLAIIDDGYMTAWGDWDSLKPKEFPKVSGGMKELADNIRMNKMMPGLWMAPYACDKHSQIAKEHPDWIIRNDEGRIANSANCGKFFYALDATNPAVREYAFKCVRRAVKEWGYECLKLDFLYAACLDGNGKYDLSMSRAETMYLALQTLRAAAGPDTFLIGCGCPLGPAIGFMDSMRISADTGPTWYPDFPLPWWDHATLPSLRAMIRNSTTRACLGHRWWHNDPDCVLLGETTSLTDNEVVSAASVVAMTGGMLLLSDDLSKLTSERIRVATRIFPVTGVTAVVLDLHSNSISGLPSLLRLWCSDATTLSTKSLTSIEVASRNSMHSAFSPIKPWKNPGSRERNYVPVAKGLGTWSIVSLSNWLDVERIVSIPIISLLPPKTLSNQNSDGLDLGYHVFAFWSSTYIWVSHNKSDDQKTISKRLGPHETEIFHVKPVQAFLPQYIGSEFHFTCGYEVESLTVTTNSLELQLNSESKKSGFVYLFIPTFERSMQVTMNGTSVRAEVVGRTPQVDRGNVTHGGQVIRVYVVMSGSLNDGKVTCKF